MGSSWDRFGIGLGSSWDRFEYILGSFWNRFGIVLGSFWDRFGVVFGIVFGSLRTATLDARRPILRVLWPPSIAAS